MNGAATQCNFCGYFHLPDYSDVMETAQEWIKAQCETLKPKSVAKASDGRVFVEPKTPEPVVQMPKLPPVLHVKYKRIHGHAGSPTQGYRGDAGYDLEICEGYTLFPGQWTNLRTGVVAAIPEGYWGHILARSSTWRNLGINVQPAVIDSSYRGELFFYSMNMGKEPIEVKMGQRLAQIIIIPLPNVEWIEQRDLPTTERGERGYGSSGE